MNSYKCNISDPNAVTEMAKQVRSDIGNIDVLINNAGIVSGKNLFELNNGKIN
jgi:all-trans-retinol dehydrogenase (NAD+)